jgi:hypothetical protein
MREVVTVVHPDPGVVRDERDVAPSSTSSESTHHGLPVAGIPSRAGTTA